MVLSMSNFNYNGTNIYYEVKGNTDSNTTVAFFNGVMATTSSWINQVSVFEKLGFRIILHDFKGQLKSDKPQGPYTFREHALEAKALFEYLEIDKVHIIGTSYGGEVAMRFAVDFPDNVQTISIIDSVSELDEVLKQFVRGWKTLAEIGDPQKFYYGMLPTLYHTSYMENNLDLINKRGETFNKLPESYFQGQITLYETFERDVTMTSLLKDIKCPSLVVCGEDDILKPKKFSKIIAQNIPNSEYVTIPDCGHVTIFEKPNELNSVLLGFVLKHCANDTSV